MVKKAEASGKRLVGLRSIFFDVQHHHGDVASLGNLWFGGGPLMERAHDIAHPVSPYGESTIFFVVAYGPRRRFGVT